MVFFLCSTMVAQVEPPKREIRAAWLTTVWAIDWPNERGTDAATAEKQKKELRYIIDKMHAANMNTVFFQVRGFSDAMYKSSYEPWSIYLVGRNGGEPTYDPLAYAVEYAHSLGMELHAWVNPYRYSTSQETYATGPNSYSQKHPDWLMNSDQYTVILNPGIPEVRDQIAKVIAEIVTNYDIDGVLFDDYFYINGGTKDEQDQQYFEKYNPNNLSRGDWRREQVNLMVKQVYETIKGIKPRCRFGISPAGVAAAKNVPAVAAKYGVEPCPVSSDWQYNGIYSDPLAWLSSQTLDYISPQIYWKIGAKADYDQICDWWSKVANKFGRHFYSSSTLQYLSDWGDKEIVNQVELNRAYDKNGATGSVFYSLSDGLDSRTFMETMRTNVFSNPALQPAMAWHAPTTNYCVSNITYSNDSLRWTAPAENLRYAVYAVPTSSIGTHGVLASSKYLLGVTYKASYALPELKADYSYVVTVYDRYGNEHSPVVMGKDMQTLAAATLLHPTQGATTLLPCDFTWKSVSKADSYIFQMAGDASFDSVLYQYETIEPTFYMGNASFVEEGKTYYWRVITRGIGAKESYSEVRSFVSKYFNIVSPTNGQEEVSQTPLLRCDSVLTKDATYTFELATSATFAENRRVFTVETNRPSYQVPTETLAPSTRYHLRASVRYGSISATSSVVQFRTLDLPVPVPQILRPLTGDTISSAMIDIYWAEQNASAFKVELSTSTSFAPRSTRSKVIEDAYTFHCQFDRDVDKIKLGIWYLRVLAGGPDGYSEPSEVQKIVVVEPTSVEYAAQHTYYIANGMLFAQEGLGYSVYTIDGRVLATGITQAGGTQLPDLAQGMYIVRVGNEIIKTTKQNN